MSVAVTIFLGVFLPTMIGILELAGIGGRMMGGDNFTKGLRIFPSPPQCNISDYAHN